MANVKGSALTSRALWVRLNHGEEGVGRLLEAVTPPTREALTAIQKSEWYPFEAFIDLNLTIDRLYGTSDLSLVRTLGRFGADANLTTIYRLFYAVGTVKWILDRAARLWDVHYDAGKLLVVRHPGPEAEMRIVRFPTPHRAHCLSVMGWAERSIELSGGRDVTMEETACRARGDEDCSFHARWT